jgi:N-acetylmuramoyl-L-alanine amidase
MKNIAIVIFATAFFYTLWFAGNYPKALGFIDFAYEKIQIVLESASRATENVAAVLLHKPVTVNELQDKYATKKVRILIVPGHEPNYGGAEYGYLKEREMTVELSKYLADFLKNNGRYEVTVARDEKDWNPIFLYVFYK